MVAQLYARLYGLVKDHFKRNLPGLGFLLGRIKRPHTLRMAGGGLLYFHPAVARSYVRLVAGAYNEPETISFLHWLLTRAMNPVQFIDVGANVGEMVISAARHPNVTSAIAFEPNMACVEAITHSAELNHLGCVRVVCGPLADAPREIRWEGSDQRANAGRISSSETGELVCATTLDAEEPSYAGDSLVLVDVEGAEVMVLQGAQEYIRRNRPLIIFEYNDTSKQVWRMPQMVAALGDDYRVLRLRSDGLLDSDVERAWNCVAVHAGSAFASIIREREVREPVTGG